MEETLLFALIEERKGIENVERIAAVKGLGGLFFGPFDLAVSKGDPDMAFDAAATHDQRELLYSAAKRNGLPVADLAWDLDSAAMLIKAGAQMIALGTDLTMFANSLQSLREGIQSLSRP